MNGEYGFEFTKGFQEGDEESGAGPPASPPSSSSPSSSSSSNPSVGSSAGFGTSYWKASVIAKHYAAYSLETSTIPSAANNASGDEGQGFVSRHAFDAVVSAQDLAETYENISHPFCYWSRALL
jgi:hypothetical protein